jgi:hypothetical protein
MTTIREGRLSLSVWLTVVVIVVIAGLAWGLGWLSGPLPSADTAVPSASSPGTEPKAPAPPPAQ